MIFLRVTREMGKVYPRHMGWRGAHYSDKFGPKESVASRQRQAQQKSNNAGGILVAGVAGVCGVVSAVVMSYG